MTPLVLLHGALGAATDFAGLAAALGAVRPVLALDLPGHGLAADPAYDVAEFAAAVAAALGEPADVFGYSLGGYVALYLARHHPDRVRRVTTFATKLAWTPELAEREARRLDADRLASRTPAFVAALEARHPGPGWRAVLDGTAGLLRSLGAAPPVDEELLRGIEIPVRVCVGDRDEFVTIEESVAAYRALPHGELAVLPGLAHPLEGVPVEALVALTGTT